MSFLPLPYQYVPSRSHAAMSDCCKACGASARMLIRLLSSLFYSSIYDLKAKVSESSLSFRVKGGDDVSGRRAISNFDVSVSAAAKNIPAW